MYCVLFLATPMLEVQCFRHLSVGPDHLWQAAELQKQLSAQLQRVSARQLAGVQLGGKKLKPYGYLLLSATMPLCYVPCYILCIHLQVAGPLSGEHEKSIEVLFTLALTDMLHLTDQFRYSEVVKLELQLQDQLPTIKALTLKEHVEVLGRIQRFKIRILLVGLTAIVLKTRMPLRGSDMFRRFNPRWVVIVVWKLVASASTEHLWTNHNKPHGLHQFWGFWMPSLESTLGPPLAAVVLLCSLRFLPPAATHVTRCGVGRGEDCIQDD